MKPIFLFAVCTASLMTTACSNADSPLETSLDVPVDFYVEGVNATSRSATSDRFVTTFEAQDKIGIYSTGLQTDMVNAEFTYVSGDVALAGSDSYRFKANAPADFYAYFPYRSDVSAKEVVFTTAADQSDAAKFNACDFMTAKQTVDASAGNGTVTLSFKHQMAFVELTFGAGLNGKVTSVEMVVPQNTVTLNATEQTTTTSGNAVTVKMYPQTAGQKYWAIVAPQTFTPSADALFKINTKDHKTFSYKPAAQQTLTANNIHKYKLDVDGNSTFFNVSSVTITAWNGTGGQAVEDKVTEDKAAKAKYTATLTAGTRFKAVGNRAEMNVDDSWAKDKTEITSCEYDALTSSLRFQSKSPSWYKGLYYYGGTTAKLNPAAKYKISFKAKSAGASGIQVVVATKDKSQGKDNFYLIGTELQTQNVTMQSVKVGTADFMSKVIYVDASFYATAANSRPAKIQNTESRDFVICFQAKDLNTDYYIKDLVVEEL